MPPQSSPTTTNVLQATHPADTPSSPVGSPPLILAFLAIGIFSAAMIAVFGWRRVRFGGENNPWGHNAVGANARRFGSAMGAGSSPSGGGRLEGSTVGEKPTLWELWTDRSMRADGLDYGFWDNVMPLAVLPVPHPLRTEQSTLIPPPTTSAGQLTSSSAPPASPANTQSPPSSSSHPSRRQHFGDLTSLSLFRRHIRAQADVVDPSTTNSISLVEKGVDKEETAEEIAQVAIIIEMPSLASSRDRHHHHHPHSHQSYGHHKSHSLYSSLSKSETLVETHDRMREDLLGIEGGRFQYSIGVHTCPWPISASTDLDSC